MKHTIDSRSCLAAPVRVFFTTALLLGCTMGVPSQAVAQEGSYRAGFPSQQTTTLVTPPRGNQAFLLGHAIGTQGYVCLPRGAGASWTVNPARPEATLFTDLFENDVQIVTHFLSPNTHPNRFAPNPLPFGNATWQNSFDSSKVWAQAVQSIDAGTDPSCPNAGSISCLLLQVIGADPGPGGGQSLLKTTFIQRLNTKGGSAPADGCATTSDVGNQKLVPYTADYYFFRKND